MLSEYSLPSRVLLAAESLSFRQEFACFLHSKPTTTFHNHGRKNGAVTKSDRYIPGKHILIGHTNCNSGCV
jgi:hypothetical protein